MFQPPNDLIPLPTMPWAERPEALPLEVEEVRTAIWKARGNVTVAAELMKVPSRRLRTFINASAYLSMEQKESLEQLKDIAEDVVYDALTDDEDKQRQDTMARFVLTGPGKDRGWGTGSGPGINIKAKGNIIISWGDGSQITGTDDAKVIEHG